MSWWFVVGICILIVVLMFGVATILVMSVLMFRGYNIHRFSNQIHEDDIKHGHCYFRPTINIPFGWHYGIGYVDHRGHKWIIDFQPRRYRDEHGVDMPVVSSKRDRLPGWTEYCCRMITLEEFAADTRVHEVDLRTSTVGYSVRTYNEIAAMAYDYTQKPCIYKLFGWNCAQYIIFCLYRDWARIQDIPMLIGQSARIKAKWR